MPRNDELVGVTSGNVIKARQELGISPEKKVILYAPTYREYEKDEKLNNVISPPVDFNEWHTRLGDEYLVLFKAHYEIVKALNIKENKEFVINVSDYKNLNQLMIASDMLISDYSSIFFDFSLLSRPILCFAYDFDEYNNKRGLYVDIDKELPSGIFRKQEDVLNAIVTMDEELEINKAVTFNKKYVEASGNATEKAVKTMIGY